MFPSSIGDSGHIKTWEGAEEKEIGFVTNTFNMNLSDLLYAWKPFQKWASYYCPPLNNFDRVTFTEHKHLIKRKVKKVN